MTGYTPERLRCSTGSRVTSASLPLVLRGAVADVHEPLLLDGRDIVRDRLEFERDAAAGTLPDFSLIEPNFISGHGDYHPAFGRSLGRTVDVTTLDPPSSMLAGEAFLERIFDAYRSSTSESGSNVWNTALLIGWDEPGGTYDHVPPGPVPPPDPDAPAGDWASRSTDPATAFPRSWSPRGSRKARCSTTSTATPR